MHIVLTSRMISVYYLEDQEIHFNLGQVFLLTFWQNYFRNLVLQHHFIFQELVELVLEHYEAAENLHFLEVGCGSGAICISLLTEMPKVNYLLEHKYYWPVFSKAD